MPKPKHPSRPGKPLTRLFALGLASLAFGAAGAADGTRMEEARMQFEKDRAACHANAQYRDVNACLREAGAAFEIRRRGKQEKMPAASNSNFQENALRRCQIFTGDERSQCEQRIMNGPVEGSVKRGGVLFESRVRETPSETR